MVSEKTPNETLQESRRKNIKEITSDEKIFRHAFGHIYIYIYIYIYEKIENTSSCQEELTKDRREEEGSTKSYGIAKDSCLRRFCKEVGLYRNLNTGTFLILNKEKQRFCR